MPPPPNTAQLTLTRSDSSSRIKHFWGTPLRLQIASTWDLTGVTVLSAQIHAQRRLAGQQPLAEAILANPIGYDAVIEFEWAQTCLPLRGTESATFFLLISAVLPDGSPEVYELGTITVIGNPNSDIAAPSPTYQLYATAALVAAEASSRAAADALLAPKASPSFSGPTRTTGQLLVGPANMPASDARVKAVLRSDVPNGFAVITCKADGDVDDVNIMGGTLAHHSHTYGRTPMYAGISQWYALAGGRGAVLGCNTFTGLNVNAPYIIPADAQANRWVAIEVGPTAPLSRKAFWVNDGDYLVAFVPVLEMQCSQSGDVVTYTGGGYDFSPIMVGRHLCWGTRTEGLESAVDRIIEYIDATHVRVERSRTIAAQSLRYGYFQHEMSADGKLRLTGPNNIFEQNAHSGVDHGGHRKFEICLGAVTVGTTPAVLYGPDDAGDYHQLWHIDIVAVSSDLASVAKFERKVQTIRLNGVHEITTPVVPSPDTNTGGFSIALSFAGNQLRITVTGPAGVDTTWTADCRCVQSTVI